MLYFANSFSSQSVKNDSLVFVSGMTLIMFDSAIYKNRREKLKKLIGNGIILLPGNREIPMNYPSNAYSFRQDSSFLYFFGLNLPDMAGLIDIDRNLTLIFGTELTLEDLIWTGPQTSGEQLKEQTGADQFLPLAKLSEYLKTAGQSKIPVHYLPSYHAETKLQLKEWLGIPLRDQQKSVSERLIRAVVNLRSVKSDEEIREIEKAADITARMHLTAMKMARPGISEQSICGVLEGIAISAGGRLSFPTILSMHGETLHNHHHGGILEEGKLLLTDAGCETEMGYAADMTRTVPVGGDFCSRQKEVYSIVLEASNKSIEMTKPGILYRDVHMEACRTLAEGLNALGLMKGDSEEAVREGAHALFMPHGIGHMLGLDVHDMEGLGEDRVGYDDKVSRSTIFGHASLRMARELEPGFVVTNEPGIYFIPGLIDLWKAEKRHLSFLNYDRIETFRDFGGIRLENDLLITPVGHHIFGKPVPRTIKEIEKTIKKP